MCPTDKDRQQKAGFGAVGAIIIIAALILVGVAGWVAYDHFRSMSSNNTHQATDPRLAALERLPVYGLWYSDAVLLGQFGTPPSRSIDGASGAVATRSYGIALASSVGITPSEIVAWYASRIQSQGWTISNLGNEAQYQVQEEWVKGGDYVHVGVYFPNAVKYYEPSVSLSAYPVVFEVEVGELNY